jgi:hypothetical protein
MEIKNDYYKHHLKDRCKDVPQSMLKDIITEFMANAKFYMNSNTDTETMEKVNTAIVDLLHTKFGYLPLYLVGEAYTRGPLGELGGYASISVRNIYIWLSAVNEKAQNLSAQDQSKLDDERRSEAEKIFKLNQAHNVRFGTALSIKLTWVYEGRIDANDWDKYTLDAIVDKLKQGYDIHSLRPTEIYNK